jgi:hypothetical protein
MTERTRQAPGLEQQTGKPVINTPASAYWPVPAFAGSAGATGRSSP